MAGLSVFWHHGRVPYADPVKAKAHHIQRNKALYHRNKEKYSAIARLRNTGFTAEVFEACAICRCAMSRTQRGHDYLNADHCHTAKEPRGLLCTGCNLSLGIYEARQRPAGLRFEPYETYLANPPAKEFL